MLTQFTNQTTVLFVWTLSRTRNLPVQRQTLMNMNMNMMYAVEKAQTLSGNAPVTLQLKLLTLPLQ
jgi:hypothetical protein